MLKKIDWESQIGRRLRLRDLHVFFTVAQHGSMAKAAAQLGVSIPTVLSMSSECGFSIDLRRGSSRPCMATRCSSEALQRSTN
jgi:hypothetical protein